MTLFITIALLTILSGLKTLKSANHITTLLKQGADQTGTLMKERNRLAHSYAIQVLILAISIAGAIVST